MTPSTKKLIDDLINTNFESIGSKTVKIGSNKREKRKTGPQRDTEKAAQVAKMWQEGKTARQIGVSMGMTISAVYMALQRIRRRGGSLENRMPGPRAWKDRI